MTERVLVIQADGTVLSVYSDRLPLRSLGRLSVTRASTVEWDEAKQCWRAREVASGRVLAEGPNREQVVAQEIAQLEKNL